MGESGNAGPIPLTSRFAGSGVVGVMLLAALSACQNRSGPSLDDDQAWGGYPFLRSVPSEPRPSASLEDRREIVRGLIEERNRSRQQTAIVRHRSGLLATLPTEQADDGPLPEDIIPDARKHDEPFRLRPENKVSADSVYRDNTEFEDGGLDDFIRDLEQNTGSSQSDDLPAADDDADEDDLSFDQGHPPDLTSPEGSEPLLLAAFAPVIAGEPQDERQDIGIRLAAGEGEPGFFCGWLGWTVAWSSMCVPDGVEEPEPEPEPEPESEEDFSVDVEPPPPAEQEPSADTENEADTETERERAERRLSEEDAAEAIEDSDGSAMAPLSSSLAKLRDFIRARGANRDQPSSQGSSAYRAEAAPAGPSGQAGLDAAARPPLPKSRPERREDIIITDRGEEFSFYRTPTPAFKPSQEDLTVVILPPEEPPPSAPPPRPRLRPSVPTAAKNLPDPPPDTPKPDTQAPDTSEPEITLSDQSKADPALSDEVTEADPPVEPTAPPDPDPEIPVLNADAADPEVDVPDPEADADVVADLPANPPGEEQLLPEPTLPEPTHSAPIPREPASPQPAPSDLELPDAAATPVEPEMAINGSGGAVDGPAVAEVDGDTTLVLFGPDDVVLPEEAKPRLATLLDEARARDDKIYIIGESATNHLAKRRATDVGAALVQLGATVEILEYDHEAKIGVDQVRLVLRPATDQPLDTPTGQTVIER